MTIDPELQRFLLDALKKGSEFTETQAPLVVEEILRWEWYSGLGLVVLLLIPLLIIFSIFLMAAKDAMKGDADAFGVAVCFFFLMLLPVAGIVAGASKMVKASVSPRLVVIEKLQDYLK